MSAGDDHPVLMKIRYELWLLVQAAVSVKSHLRCLQIHAAACGSTY